MTIDARLTVSISAPKEQNLSRPQCQFLLALIQRIEREGLRVVHYSADDADTELVNVGRCHGMVVLAFSQWTAERAHRQQNKTIVVPTEFNHILATMAVATKRPLLVFREKVVAERGVLRGGYLPRVVKLPRQLAIEWLDSYEFSSEFNRWLAEVDCSRHVFLGYSSQATKTGETIRQFIGKNMGLRVFDWHDFRPGDLIWESIERAERLTDCGIFPFMADDKLGVGNKAEFAPRGQCDLRGRVFRRS